MNFLPHGNKVLSPVAVVKCGFSWLFNKHPDFFLGPARSHMLPFLLQQPHVSTGHSPRTDLPPVPQRGQDCRPTSALLYFLLLLPRTLYHILAWLASCYSGLMWLSLLQRGLPWPPYLTCVPTSSSYSIYFLSDTLNKIRNFLVLFIYIHIHPLECKFSEARDLVFWFTST